jgi:hypothetical protein
MLNKSIVKILWARIAVNTTLVAKRLVFLASYLISDSSFLRAS